MIVLGISRRKSDKWAHGMMFFHFLLWDWALRTRCLITRLSMTVGKSLMVFLQLITDVSYRGKEEVIIDNLTKVCDSSNLYFLLLLLLV